jgi:hypothetical protein
VAVSVGRSPEANKSQRECADQPRPRKQQEADCSLPEGRCVLDQLARRLESLGEPDGGRDRDQNGRHKQSHQEARALIGKLRIAEGSGDCPAPPWICAGLGAENHPYDVQLAAPLPPGRV